MREETVKNYRLQPGCWNCIHFRDTRDEYVDGATECSLDMQYADLYGICDLHEKEPV